MKICYKNANIEKICTDEKAAMRFLKKSEDVKILFKRIEGLVWFECLNDVPIFEPYRRHKLKGKRKGIWAIKLNRQLRFCFSAVLDESESLNDTDLRSITSICIESIEDYHDE